MFAFDPLPALKKYSGPKLIISTTREDQQPTSLHNQVPGIPHHAFDGTSHWIMLDKPEEFNQLLDDFIRDIKP
jgi:pimeloyl-ACP methyl ester carboxylesterase